MPRYETVTRADDPRLDDYRRIREAELVRRRGCFIAEGTGVVRTLVERGRFPIRSVLIAERRLEGVRATLDRLPAYLPVLVAPHALVSEVAGFDLHRGCLAAGARSALDAAGPVLDALPARGPSRVLVLEGVANHDNVGALFRNGAAFGVDAVLLDARTADPLYRKAIRTSMGHALVLPFARVSRWPDAIDELRARGYAVVALTPGEGAAPLFAWTATERVALVVGTEGAGLSAEALDRCDARLKIPMGSGVDSLNVATAAAVALYELTRGSLVSTPGAG